MSEPVEPLVDAEMERDDLVPEHLPRCWFAEVTRHLWVIVQVK